MCTGPRTIILLVLLIGGCAPSALREQPVASLLRMATRPVVGASLASVRPSSSGQPSGARLFVVNSLPGSVDPLIEVDGGRHVAVRWGLDSGGGRPGSLQAPLLHLRAPASVVVRVSLVGREDLLDTLAVVGVPVDLAAGHDYVLQVEISSRPPGGADPSGQGAVLVPAWLRIVPGDSLRVTVSDVSRRQGEGWNGERSLFQMQ